MPMEQKLVTVSGQVAGPVTVYGANLLLPGSGAVVREVSEVELGLPREYGRPDRPPDAPALFRAAHDHAVKQGFVGGYPVFEERREVGRGHQLVLLPASAAKYYQRPLNQFELQPGRVIPLTMLGHCEIRGRSEGYACAYPTFHELKGGDDFGVVYLERGVVRWEDVPGELVKGIARHDIASYFRKLHEYAVRLGCISAIPTGHMGTFESGLARSAHLATKELEREGWRVVQTTPLPVSSSEGAAVLLLLERPQPGGQIAPEQIVADSGHGYTAPIPPEHACDSSLNWHRSRLRLFEGEKELGPAHHPHSGIRENGAGRFSHWGASVTFAASDNSDPRTNGRIYTWRIG